MAITVDLRVPDFLRQTFFWKSPVVPGPVFGSTVRPTVWRSDGICFPDFWSGSWRKSGFKQFFWVGFETFPFFQRGKRWDLGVVWRCLTHKRIWSCFSPANARCFSSGTSLLQWFQSVFHDLGGQNFHGFPPHWLFTMSTDVSTIPLFLCGERRSTESLKDDTECHPEAGKICETGQI